MTREEAIEVYHGLISTKIKEAFEFFAPELAESEDEKTKRMLNTITYKMSQHQPDIFTEEENEWFNAYLERQKDLAAIPDELVKNYKLFCENGRREVAVLINAINGINEQKEQKPILEVFGFKVGDAVRLKDGDGRKHIIKSFEEVEGIHGPNFYLVYFEDNSARDGIYPGEEYPNGYYTQMEKFEEEQKPAVWSEDFVEWSEDFDEEVGKIHKRYPEMSFAKLTRIAYHFSKWANRCKDIEWSEEDEKDMAHIIRILDDCYAYGKHDLSKTNHENLVNFLKSLRPQPKDERYKEKDEAFKLGKHQLAIKFMNYLDENRPEGKMGLSNSECEDIDKAFKENDWAKIMRYVEKYSPSWRPSEEQMRALKETIDFAPETFKPRCTLMTLQHDLNKLTDK